MVAHALIQVLAGAMVVTGGGAATVAAQNTYQPVPSDYGMNLTVEDWKVGYDPKLETSVVTGFTVTGVPESVKGHTVTAYIQTTDGEAAEGSTTVTGSGAEVVKVQTPVPVEQVTNINVVLSE